MAGPFVDAADGAIGIFTSRAAAEEFIDGDPFVLSGFVKKCTIREWDESSSLDREFAVDHSTDPTFASSRIR
jgi:hypothetical protein